MQAVMAEKQRDVFHYLSNPHAPIAGRACISALMAYLLLYVVLRTYSAYTSFDPDLALWVWADYGLLALIMVIGKVTIHAHTNARHTAPYLVKVFSTATVASLMTVVSRLNREHPFHGANFGSAFGISCALQILGILLSINYEVYAEKVH